MGDFKDTTGIIRLTTCENTGLGIAANMSLQDTK